MPCSSGPPVAAADAAAVDDLSALRGDSFDRMPVAQAPSRPMHLMTHDARPTDYPALTIPA